MSHPSYFELARSARVLTDTHRDLFGSTKPDDSQSLTTEASQRLQRATEMLKALLELHPQPAAIADLQATWVLANNAFGKLFGLSTSLRTLVGTWKDHFAMPLRTYGSAPWNGLSRERPRVHVWFVKRKHDGTRARFMAHGRLLEHKPDGNYLVGWTFFEAGTSPDAALPPALPEVQSEKASGTSGPVQRTRSHKARRDRAPRDCQDCVDKSREALKLLLLHTNDQKRDVEKRIAENYLITIAPLIDHLKSLNLAPSQAYLLETLEFNLKHINSIFRINVRAHTKKLSSREIEICQMIRAGKDSRQIAHALGLKIQTVMVHRKHIRRKLGLRKGSVRLSTFLQATLEPLY